MFKLTIGDVFRAVTGFRPAPVAPVAPVAPISRPVPVAPAVPVVPATSCHRINVLGLLPNDVLLDGDGNPCGLVVSAVAYLDRVTVNVAPLTGGDAVPQSYRLGAQLPVLSV